MLSFCTISLFIVKHFRSRSKSLHQSNGSLHSDSPSSSSVSPAPSPSPRPNTVHGIHNSGLAKRWSSTGDFNVQSPLQGSRFEKDAFLIES